MSVNKEQGETLILHALALTPTLARRSGSKALPAPAGMDAHQYGEGQGLEKPLRPTEKASVSRWQANSLAAVRCSGKSSRRDQHLSTDLPTPPVSRLWIKFNRLAMSGPLRTTTIFSSGLPYQGSSPVPSSIQCLRTAIDLPVSHAMSLTPSPSPLHRRQLRVLQRQPFHSLGAEIDLHARIRPAPFGRYDHARTKPGVPDVLPDAPAAGR